MANIAFKRGLQSALAASTFKPDDGTFYLTTDSHRLYVGQGDALVDLNKYIKEVADQTALMELAAENGDFVYVKEGNLLVVCTDKTATTATTRWTQVNPNTDTNTDQWLEYKSVADTAVAGTSVTSTITFTKHNKDVKNNKDTTSTVTIPVSITRANLASALALDVDASVASNKATIKASSGGEAQGAGFTISGGSNVTISGSGDALVISATNTDTNTTYDLLSPANSTNIVLKDSGNAEDVVKLKAGTQIALDGTTAGEITISHGDVVTTDATTNATVATLGHSGSFTVMDNITRDENGHVLTYEKKTYKLPGDNNTKNSSVTVTAGADGDLSVAIKDSSNATVTGTLDGGLYYEVNGQKIYNQGDLASATYFVDMKEKLDDLEDDLAGIDALRYKGTVGTNGTVTTLPTASIQIGDTYKVASAGTYGSIKCEVGDLLIATGTEGADGYITSASLVWTHIAQGSDTDTTYTLTGAGNKITLKGSTNSTNDITVEGGTNISATVASNKLTVAHSAVTRTDAPATETTTLAHGAEVEVVTGVTSSTTGHVTGITTTKYKLPGDNNTTYTLPAEQVTANEQSKITLTSNGGSKDVVNFKADRSTNTSLSVNGSADTITYKHTDYTYSNPTDMTSNTNALTHGGKLKVVTGANVTNGHITGLTTTEYTLPADNNTTYTLSGTTAAATVSGYTSAVKVTDSLDANAGSDSSFAHTITSNSLKLTAGTKTYNIDLEWGTF